MTKESVRVKNKYRFLETILQYQISVLYISFEGKLLNYGFDKIDEKAKEEDSTLKRNVVEPKADFFVFDLNATNVQRILKVLKMEDLLEWDIFHIKIANAQEMVFESYDWFSYCYLDTDYYDVNFMNNLINMGIIEPV